MSPEFRIVSYLLFVTSLFLLPDPRFYGAIFVILCLLMCLIPFRTIMSGWLPITIFLIFTFISNALYSPGRIIFSAGPLVLTDKGIMLAGIRTMRVILMIGGVKLLMAKTKTDDMVRAMANLLSPFERLGLPVHDFFHVMGLTLKCFPVLKDVITRHYLDKIKDATSESALGKAKMMAYFLMPLFSESIHNPERFFPEMK